jgi:hypothetical protein
MVSVSGDSLVWLSGRGDGVPSMRCCPSEAPPVGERDLAEARERLRVASLDSTDQMEPTEPAERCPRSSGRVVIELYSGSVYPDRCRSSQCAFCLPLNARRRCLAITYAAPQRMIGLSALASERDPNPGATVLTAVGIIRRNLKRIGREPGEWCFTVEQNPEKTGYHAHCLQRGRSIPQAELQESCARAGVGIPYINSIKREGIWTSRYGLKGFGADGYGLKSFRATGNAQESLRINNGRMEHHSRGFFAIDGEIQRVRSMESMAIAAMNGIKRCAYVACTEDRSQSIMNDPQLRHAMIRDLNVRSVSAMRAFP